MRRTLLGISLILGLSLLLATTTGPQTPQQNPYLVVTSKPIVHGSWRADSSYIENPRLTEMMNQLVKDGLEPLYVQVSTEFGNPPIVPQDRLIVVCRRK